jgi:hypothetical protein
MQKIVTFSGLVLKKLNDFNIVCLARCLQYYKGKEKQMKILAVINFNTETMRNVFEIGQKVGKRAKWEYINSLDCETLEGLDFDGAVVYTGKYDQAKAVNAVIAENH